MKLVACVLALGACSGLSAIDTPTCGNGIIETGEDCDSQTGCKQCALECTAAHTCDHVGFACGADGFCHAPSGRFHPESNALPFQVEGYGATDIDADGYNDVVALTGTSLTVHHGDAAGKLDAVSTTIVPFVEGSPAVTNLDPDTTLDIVIPTADGLVAYTSRFQTMSPFAFPIALDTTMALAPKPLRAFTLDTHYLALLVDAKDMMTGTHYLGAFIIDGSQRALGASMMTTAPVPLCAGFVPMFDHDRFDSYDTATTHLITLANPDGALCLIEIAPTATPGTYSFNASHHPSASIMTRPVLARLGPGACPSVIGATTASMMSPPIAEYPGTGAPGTCGVATGSPRALPNAAGGVPLGVPRGHVRLLPAIGNQGPDALAYQGGVFAIDKTTAALQTLFFSNREISEIQTLDVDGDGDLDAVTSSGSFDDLQVLYRYSAGGDGFLPVSVDTVGIPLNLAVGDFDGDGIGDVTYTEKLAGFERLMVAYGSRDQVHAPAVVSTYTDVIETGTIELRSSVDPTARVLDMYALDGVLDANGHRVPDVMLLSVLLGSPQRTLTPFYDPGTASGSFTGAVAGDFGATASTYHELFNVVATPDGYSWLTNIVPDKFGAMSPGINGPSQNLRFCEGGHGPPGPSPVLCLDGFARYVAWRPDPKAPTDLVLGVDNDPAHNIILLDPRQVGGAPVGLALGSLVDGSQQPRDVELADIDGDGLVDAILGYGSRSLPAAGHVVACMDNPTFACSELVAPELAGWVCDDATPAHVVSHHYLDQQVAPTSDDLAILCRKADTARVFRVFHDGSGYHAAPLLDVATDAIDFKLVDVTGDGVEDVLVRDAEAVLHIYPQCTSREEQACADPAELPP